MDEIKKIKKLIKKHRHKHPTFRGRFGVRSVRSPKNKKWDRWRVPRGIDIIWEKSDGKKPDSGYRTPRKIRGLHPSGKKEIYVKSIKDLEKVDPNLNVVRLSRTLGKKKRLEIIKLAEEKGIKILNKGV